MAKASRGSSSGIAPRAVLGAIVISLVSTSAAAAETASIDDLVSAVVRINTHINPEGRTVQGLGREREGSGILIDRFLGHSRRHSPAWYARCWPRLQPRRLRP